MRSLDDRVLSGLLFMLAGATFLIGVMISETIAPGYSMNTNAISDLGTIPESALLFNLTLVLTGALTLAGGLLMFRQDRKRGITVLFILAGAGAIGAGVFNLNTPGIHGLFALLAFITYNLLAMVCARMTSQPMRTISLVLGAVGLVFVVIMFLGDSGMAGLFGSIGHGGTERMIVYPVMVWLLAFGGYLMGRSDNAQKS